MFMDWEAHVFALKQFLLEQFVMLHFAQTEFSVDMQFIVYMHKCVWIWFPFIPLGCQSQFRSSHKNFNFFISIRF